MKPVVDEMELSSIYRGLDKTEFHLSWMKWTSGIVGEMDLRYRGCDGPQVSWMRWNSGIVDETELSSIYRG